jgi:hypothetical protein
MALVAETNGGEAMSAELFVLLEVATALSFFVFGFGLCALIIRGR